VRTIATALPALAAAAIATLAPGGRLRSGSTGTPSIGPGSASLSDHCRPMPELATQAPAQTSALAIRAPPLPRQTADPPHVAERPSLAMPLPFCRLKQTWGGMLLRKSCWSKTGCRSWPYVQPFSQKREPQFGSRSHGAWASKVRSL